MSTIDNQLIAIRQELADMRQDRNRLAVLARTSTALCRAVLAELKPVSEALEGLMESDDPIQQWVKTAIRRCETHDNGLRELLAEPGGHGRDCPDSCSCWGGGADE